MTVLMDNEPTFEDLDMVERYQRAEALLQGLMTTDLIQNDTIFPTWIVGSDCFWYQRAYKTDKASSIHIGSEYRLVSPRCRSNETAFDHDAFADALTSASGQKVNSQALPISHVDITLCPLIVSFKAFGKNWTFDAIKKNCQISEELSVNDDEAISPDGKWIAFPRDNNLWVRELSSGEERALTYDGEQDYAYGVGGSIWGRAMAVLPALWSPDSTRLLTVQRDKRNVKSLPHVSHVPVDGDIRPQLEEYKVSYPGDEDVETFEVISVDLLSSQICRADLRPSPAGYDGDICPFFKKLTWWADDCRRAYFIDRERGDRVLRLVEFDSETGATRILIDENSDTYVNAITDNVAYPFYCHLSTTNEMIWWSERSDWGHLYLYDLNSGTLKHAITSGDWLVRDILYVDEVRRELLIQTSGRVPGRDPYYRDICRLHIDTGEITTLLSGDEEYVVHYQDTVPVIMKKMAGEASGETNGVAPNGEYFVATRTRADQVPITLLIDRTGTPIMDLEVADISALPSGWQWPEPVQLLAADNRTNIYGLLFRPSNFSPDNHYPVINFINSGPWLSVVPKGSFHTSRGYADRHYFQAASLAELGFIVLVLDSRGTPLRNKAFQNESYGWEASAANTDDHAGAIQQLSKRFPYMDIDRVGMCCNAYNSGLQNFLERQDLYKVGVQMWLTDTRMMCGPMGDRFEGVEGPDSGKLYPEQLVGGLSGKLLLMMAMNSYISAMYPTAGLFRVIEALQKANKDFDMLIVPNVDFGPDNYMYRRSWDYLVKYLLDLEPPKEFELGKVTWLGETGDLLD